MTTYTDLLYRKLSQLPIWPSRRLIDKYMPEPFKNEPPYDKTRVILDCTEIFIQRPGSSDVQQLTYSSYKSHNTAKALIGITPNCFISFISPLQPGRLSDKEIVNRSGLVEKLEAGDLVLADRGFTIGDLLSENVLLNIPAFLGSREQFTPQEIVESRKIGKLRIHVERVIGRIRRYSILNVPFPNTSLAELDKIWMICCLLTNYTYPKF